MSVHRKPSRNTRYVQLILICTQAARRADQTRNDARKVAHHQDRTPRVVSDGVFAIAITLLILEVKVPELGEEVSNARLLSELAALWPSYPALVTSFLSILIMWINHHGILDVVARCDRQFMSLNGLLLLLVSVVPFPTAVVAQYLTAPTEGIAVAVYAGMFFMTNIVFVLLWRSATRPHIVKEDVPPRTNRAGFPLYAR